MKTDLFQHEVTQTSAIFGRKNDVRVVFKGEDAMTDGSTIILPAITHGKDISDEAMKVLRGYTDHEAGHVRHSDMPFILDFNTKCIEQNNMLLKSLANALEDIWLEKRVRAEYPGAEANIKATADAVNREFLDGFHSGRIDEEQAQDPLFIAPVAITWEGRQPYVGETCEACLEILPDALRERLGVWVGRIDDCADSRDVCALAIEIEKELRDGEAESSEAPTDKPSGGGDESRSESGSEGGSGGGDEGGSESGDESGAEGDADSGSGGSGGSPADGDESGSEEGSEGGSDGERSEGSDDEAKEGEGGGAAAEEGKDERREVLESVRIVASPDRVYEGELSAAVTTVLHEEALDRGGKEYLPYTTEEDRCHHRSNKRTEVGRRLARYASECAGDYERRLAAMQGDVNAVRRQLERALMAKMNRDWDYGREDGRLDARRFTAAVAGRSNVFKQRMPRPEIDTAVSILVDLSGSMACGSPSRGEVARDCAIALSEAIDRAGVAYEVLGFSNNAYVRDAHEAMKAPRGYSRIQTLDLHVFKAFDERLVQAKGAMAHIHEFVGGDNTDGEFLMLAAKRLMERQERRRILLTLSDGQPAAARGTRADPMVHVHHLEKVIQDLQSWDFELAGIGIESRDVERFYPRSVVVSDLGDLASTGVSVLSDLLLGQRGRSRSAA
jgi:cobalamin biosynthesis protein CobT